MAEWLGAVAAVLGTAAAVLALGAAVRTWYLRTLGRRRDRFARLARLGTLARLSFFVDVLGEGPAIQRTVAADISQYDPDAGEMVELERNFVECFFVDRDYYVQAICDEEETVLGFSVTTRSRRFCPIYTFPSRSGFRQRRRWRTHTGEPFRPLLELKLGRSTFTDVASHSSLRPGYKAQLGARWFTYSEVYSFGNPGFYQTFVMTASSAVDARIGNISDVVSDLRETTGGDPNDNKLGDIEWDAADRFRRISVVSTYSVLAPTLSFENFPTSFGPHGDEVRLLP